MSDIDTEFLSVEEKQAMNIAAATILGYGFTLHDKLAMINIKLSGYSLPQNTYRVRKFCIFDNGADCLTLVKALGDKFGISMHPENDGWVARKDSSKMTETAHEDYEVVAGKVALLKSKDVKVNKK